MAIWRRSSTNLEARKNGTYPATQAGTTIGTVWTTPNRHKSGHSYLQLQAGDGVEGLDERWRVGSG